ncbi:MAG: 4-alpha-glucanotransferase [Clostridia bacterium]|nr:4-alpha-glucanotransferase [Clostridia bacterium]
MRTAGVLLHISSLPSPGGIGTLGREARGFVDFLNASGFTIWQMLPVGPTGYGESPYQSTSTFAGNPLFIDERDLVEKGLLPKDALKDAPPEAANAGFVDFEPVKAYKKRLLECAFQYAFERCRAEVEAFKEANSWLDDYAVYAALKEKFDLRSWMEWPDEYRFRKPEAMKAAREALSERIDYFCFEQYLFALQWASLKTYANERGVRLFGDMPIYVAEDSADTWSQPEQFQFDETLHPIRVAGVPPDYFSADGQLWGNPLYKWEDMEKNHFSWWIARLKAVASRFDIIRIDHFIGFANYYSIPYGATNARIGEWVDAPGRALFAEVKKQLPDLSIIAENLGVIGPRVKSLMRFCGYPGMKVLQFGFSGDSRNPQRPRYHTENCVVYTGTHDNDTTIGWFKTADEREKKCLKRITGATSDQNVAWLMILCALHSRADTAIIPMQDMLELDEKARMNVPGVLGGNWLWRMTGMPEVELAEKMRAALSETGRIAPQAAK